ncbi:hypothetical protein FI667_g912, partial [Globisporangium splendens]
MADTQGDERTGDACAMRVPDSPPGSNATIQDKVAPLPESADTSPSPHPPVRARFSASSLMTAAEIDAVLLSLSPLVADLSRQPAKTSAMRAISDSMLVATSGSAASFDSKLQPGINSVGQEEMQSKEERAHETPSFRTGENDRDDAPGILRVLLLCFGCANGFLRHKVPVLRKKRRFNLSHDAVLPQKLSAVIDGSVKQNSELRTVNEDARGKGRFSSQRQKMLTFAAHTYGEFAHIDGPYHAYYLTFQSLTLVAYLRKGFPIPMIAFYSAMLSSNWLISFYRFQRTSLDRSLIISRLFYIFDLFFVVFAPLILIVYAKHNFHFDYPTWRTREETIPVGTFDRVARMFADPTQVSMFLVGFYHLLLKSFSSVFIKCGLLFISNYKWLKIVIFLIRTNHARQRQLEIPHTRKKTKQSRRHLFFGLFFFIFFGVMLLVYTIVAIKTSTENCAPYPKCVVISYQWYAGESGCPCATYINRKTDPRTFAEWVNPVDVTDELAMVAREGQLLTVQVINRALPTLPDAMRSCKKIEKM